MINPKAPDSVRKLVEKDSRWSKVFGWDMDTKICKFKPTSEKGMDFLRYVY